MRHAKSDWSDAAAADRDRTLNRRGRRDAPRMAAWLQSINRVPDGVLCSTATRTRETLALMQEVWPDMPTVIYTDKLYGASEDEIFSVIRSEGLDAQLLMVLAHNPGISYAAAALANQTVEMPTAAAAVFDLAIDSWASLRSDCECDFAHFMRPKALPET
jgi:phosphohistidine phosphatase